MTTLTAPYLARAEDELGQSLQHVHIVEAVTALGTVTLECKSLDLTYDEGWAPYAQASIEVKAPDDQALLDALDPRRGVRILISAGYVYGDRVRDVHLVADLGLRTRTVARPGDTMTLNAASDEALLQDAGNVGNEALGREHPTLWDVTEAVRAMVPLALGAPTWIESSIAPAQVLTQPLWWSSWWSMITAWVDEVEAWFYHDGLGGWVLRPRPTRASQARHALRTGAGGTITESQADLSREGDDWANAVSTLYRWSDAAGIAYSMIGNAWISDGPLAAYKPDGTPRPGLRRLVYEFSTPANQAAANAAARALLTRRASGGRRVSATAIAAYWLRPGDTVTVQLPTGSQERHLVSRVKFFMPSGSMTITTRLPDDSTITSGE